jgi:hypothetical protein
VDSLSTVPYLDARIDGSLSLEPFPVHGRAHHLRLRFRGRGACSARPRRPAGVGLGGWPGPRGECDSGSRDRGVRAHRG